MATVDVTVMGAGVFGLSIAWELMRRGVSVGVVDPAGVGAGSSAGLVGALAPHTPERWEPKKQFQFESLIMAEEFWRIVDQDSGGNSGFGRVGRLQPIPNDHTLKLARERIDQAADLWQGKALWEIRNVDDFVDWAPPSDTGLVVHDTLSARMDPSRAIRSLHQALANNGVRVQLDGAIQGKAIWATGYQGLLALSDEFGAELGNGVKGQSVRLQYDRHNSPQIFADGIHFVPHDDGTLGIGSTSERYFDDPASTDHLLDTLLEKAYGIMNQLRKATVLEKWAGVRPRAITRAPMLGQYPGKPNHFIANGGFKIGFAMAPKIAQVMADLVLDGRDEIPDEFQVAASLEY